MRHAWPVLALALIVACAPVATVRTSSPSADAMRPPTLAHPIAPPDGETYFGFLYRWWDGTPAVNASYGDTRPFPERIKDAIAVELGGKTPSLMWVSGTWQRDDCTTVPFDDVIAQITRIRAAVGAGVVPVLDWIAGGGDLRSPRYHCATTNDVASGVLDDYVHAYARAVKAWGEPIFIRALCGEMNGSWWRNCSPKANSALSAAGFVAAWRRAVDIFRAEGADNVTWLWNPNAMMGTEVDTNVDAFWPGDEYVDWVGIDHYDVGPPSWMDSLYRFAAQHGKPVFLGEFGIRHKSSTLTPPQQRQWLDAMFDYFAQHPLIKAITYFNYKAVPDSSPPADRVVAYGGQVSYRPNVNDYDHRLIAGGPEIRALFARRIADPRYVSGVLRAPAP